jgi:hypothetical protein
LPAYCPFFNPIETMFSILKARAKRMYLENSKVDFRLVIADVFSTFVDYDMKKIFAACGYTDAGFDANVGFKSFNAESAEYVGCEIREDVQ